MLRAFYRITIYFLYSLYQYNKFLMHINVLLGNVKLTA